MYAVVSDVTRLVIPNWVSITLVALFTVFLLLGSKPLPPIQHALVAVRPVAVDGPLVSIRKFTKKVFSLDRLVENGTLKPQTATLIAAAVRCRLSLPVSGGTGTGKTTMLNALSQHISGKERLITIEDAAELQLQQPHVRPLETRPPTIEGKGEIRQ